MAIETKTCGCSVKPGEEACSACQLEETFPYWCDSCKRSVEQKRCRLCGLKTQRKKGASQE
jgi:hypothetical protein